MFETDNIFAEIKKSWQSRWKLSATNCHVPDTFFLVCRSGKRYWIPTNWCYCQLGSLLRHWITCCLHLGLCVPFWLMGMFTASNNSDCGQILRLMIVGKPCFMFNGVQCYTKYLVANLRNIWETLSETAISFQPELVDNDCSMWCWYWTVLFGILGIMAGYGLWPCDTSNMLHVYHSMYKLGSTGASPT